MIFHEFNSIIKWRKNSVNDYKTLHPTGVINHTRRVILMQKPDFSIEQEYRDRGFSVVGVDEVGRGALAGPVIAAAAFVKTTAAKAAILKLGIDDSKRLTAEKREMLLPFIEDYFLTSTGTSSVTEINKYGIVRATNLAMRRAVRNLYSAHPPGVFHTRGVCILVDGYPVKNLPGGLARQKAIIKGDRKSISIAAASIVAKVYRDKIMKSLGRLYSKYRWRQNKGYGTQFHRRALKNHGVCEQHRLLFDGIL